MFLPGCWAGGQGGEEARPHPIASQPRDAPVFVSTKGLTEEEENEMRSYAGLGCHEEALPDRAA